MQGRVWLAGAGLKSVGVYPMMLEATPNRNHITSSAAPHEVAGIVQPGER